MRILLGGFPHVSQHCLTLGIIGIAGDKHVIQVYEDTAGVKPGEPEYTVYHEMAQWVANVQDEWMTETYGTRYVFAELDQKTVSCSIRLNWSLNPKLSLQAYIQPFIAVGAYNRFKELARPRSFDFNVYGENGSAFNPETNMRLKTVLYPPF